MGYDHGIVAVLYNTSYADLRRMIVPLRVKEIRDVEWNVETFQDLEADAETKTLIQAVIQYKLESDKSIDFIKGKGTGLIILLHGFVLPSLSFLRSI